MATRPEVHEWLKSLSDEEKKNLFKEFTKQNQELFDRFLEQAYDKGL